MLPVSGQRLLTKEWQRKNIISMMKKKLVKPEDIIKAVDKEGKELLPKDDPAFLGTKPFRLSQQQPLKAINLMLPPGISTFYIERLNKNEFRFLIRVSEINRIAEKAEKMMEGNPPVSH